MKTPLLILVGLAATLTAAQNTRQIVYEDQAKNLRMAANSLAVAQATPTSRNLLLKGSVSLTSVSEGLDLRAGNVKTSIVTNTRTKEEEIRTGQASGGVRLMKTVVNKKGTQVTVLTSATADYLARAVDALVTMRSAVKIVSTNEAKRQNMVAYGSSGTAVLVRSSKTDKNGLRTATLTGAVRIEILDRSDAKGQKTIIATGSRLEIDNTTKPMTAVLTGDVKFVGNNNPLAGTLKGIKWVQFKLNEQGESQSFLARSS